MPRHFFVGRLLGLIAVGMLVGPIPAGAWTRTFKGANGDGPSSSGAAVETLPGGDVVAAGSIASHGRECIATVRLKGDDGKVVWQNERGLGFLVRRTQ